MDTEARIISAIEAMTHSFHEGNLDGILTAYEPSAVVVGEPGVPLTGEARLRTMFAGFVAAKARFTYSAHEVFSTGDVALHLAPWTMSGVSPDGEVIGAAGLSVAVLRRQSSGEWLIVIDDPYGGSLLERPSGDAGPR